MDLWYQTDSYKITHWKQYPPNTKKVYSYLEARNPGSKTLFFGLQYYLQKYLVSPSLEDLDAAIDFYRSHFGSTQFNLESWIKLKKHLEAGYGLPLEIRSIPEGTFIETGNALLTIENTDPQYYWLTNFVESLLLKVWYPTTVATTSYNIRQLILKFLESNGSPELIEYKLHDFGYRGVSSDESAMIGGMAHLVSFKGTDTIPAVVGAKTYYREPMAGNSIPAAEHSTITSWGRELECDAYKNMLDSYPDGYVAVVSDSYDIYNACDQFWGTKLKNQVINRNGTVVIRPDSGEPTSEIIKLLGILGSKFSYRMNGKSYKELPPQIRLIWGDGINYKSINDILQAMHNNGWSSNNIAFGMGGALLQKVDRDTYGFALKCSSIRVGEEDRDVYKQPITDPEKNSKRGRLKVIRTWEDKAKSTVFQTVPELSPGNDLLRLSFIDGKIIDPQTLTRIRERANNTK